MSDPVACALISFAGVVLSGSLSLIVARVTFAKEAAKLRLQWGRDDIVASDTAFSEMASTVAKYTYAPDDIEKQAAASCAVSAIRATQADELGKYLDSLCAMIDEEGSPSQVRSCLRICIEQKRQQIHKRDGQSC